MLDFEGITVLSTIASAENPSLDLLQMILINLSLIFCWAGLVALFCAIFQVRTTREKISRIIMAVLTAIMVISLTVSVIKADIANYRAVDTTDTYYLIEVDNDVSLVEFFDNFEIIEKRDSNIFLVKPLDKTEIP